MGTTPGQRGRFGSFDVVSQADHWDPETRAVVTARLGPPAPLAFFSAEEEPTGRALLDRLLGQDEDPKVPLLEPIDDRLLHREGDGYRFDDMPEDGEAWKRSIAALDEESRRLHGRPFWAASRRDQKEIIEAVRTESSEWHGLPGTRVFQLWMRYALTAFYSHPWAWNEIGFPGPAYPRGYKSIGIDRLEPFETHERDAHDPIPWAKKVEAAHAEHDEIPSRTRRADGSDPDPA
jgi:hypothetical protein